MPRVAVASGAFAPKGVVGKRLATAAVAIPLFAWVTTRAPHWLFALVVLAVAATAAWELSRMFERAGHRTAPTVTVAATLLVAAGFLAPGEPKVALALAVALVLAAPLWQPPPASVEPTAIGLVAVTYVGWLVGHGLLLRRLPDGEDLVLFLVGVTWAGESAAYLVGSTVGRHKLAPTISPGKTVEGAVAQFVVSVAAAVALAEWLLPWSPPRALAAGVLLGLTGQVGDLVESALKRSAGAKDTGGVIPGHGGMLDRIDSLLFNTPSLYYFTTLVDGRP